MNKIIALCVLSFVLLSGCATMGSADHLQHMPVPRSMFDEKVEFVPLSEKLGMLVTTVTQVAAGGELICTHSVDQTEVLVVKDCEPVVEGEIQLECFRVQTFHPQELGNCFDNKPSPDLYQDHLDQIRREEGLKNNQPEKEQSHVTDGIINSPQEYAELQMLFD
jgi:hypothetical protein